MIPRMHDITVLRVKEPAPGHPVFILHGRPGDPCYVAKQENFKAAAVDGFYSDAWKSHARYDDTRENRALRDSVKKAGLEKVEGMLTTFGQLASVYAACLESLPEYRVLDAFEVARLFAQIRSASRDGEPLSEEVFTEYTNGSGAAKGLWFVMDCVDGLYDFKGLAQKLLPAHDPVARSIIQFIRHNPEQTEELGRILAIDAFLGNFDRAQFVKEGARFKVSPLNLGNFFLVGNGLNGHARFSGLDFYDPNSPYMDLRREDFVRQQEAAPWPGVMLTQGRADLKPQLEPLLTALNDEFVKHGENRVFDAGHQDALVDGFRDGAKRLKKYLKSTTGKAAGLKKRKAKLGW